MMRQLMSDFRKYRNAVALIFVFCMMATLSFLAARNMQESSAATLANFKPGNIISDAVMANYNAMTKDEIQKFLSQKGNCNNTNRQLYEKETSSYPNLSWHWENGHFVCLADERFGDGVEYGASLKPGEGQTAAEIIYEAAQDYKINPQVLIVLLEKEQSLITDSYPNSKQYRSATGYGCPDTAACNSKYYGFKNQVRNAAALFRNVLDKGYSAYPEKKAGVYVGYHPNSNCGRSEVYIENRATAALYRYTPYQPNAAALNAGYGSGDSCSAYGNRNFYLYFTDWFGSTQNSIVGELVNLPEGDYSFVTPSVDYGGLGIAEGTVNGTNIQLSTYKKANYEKWHLVKTKDGYYNIIHNSTKLAVDLNLESGNLTLWQLHDGANQKWKLYTVNGDRLIFESVSRPGMVITLNDDNNINLQSYSENNKKQLWQLFAGQTLSDGLYEISISSSKNAVIDANGTHDGDNVSIWEKHGGSNQEWLLKYDQKSDTYTFTNSLSSKHLDLSGADAKPGANVQVWSSNDSCAQKWKLIPNGQDYTLLSTCSIGYVLDLNSEKAINGANIQIHSVDSARLQQWSFIHIDSKLKSDQTYIVSAKNSSDAVVDLASAEQNALIWSKHAGWNQRWQVLYHPETDDYTLINPTTKYALDVNGSSMSLGSNVLVWSHHGGCNQRWKINRTTDGYYEILSACDTSWALDLYEGRINNGTNLQLWKRHGGDAQKFQFTPYQ